MCSRADSPVVRSDCKSVRKQVGGIVRVVVGNIDPGVIQNSQDAISGGIWHSRRCQRRPERRPGRERSTLSSGIGRLATINGDLGVK